MLLNKGLATFQGWWARKSIVWGAIIAAYIVGHLDGWQAQVEQFAALQGISAAKIKGIHESLTGLVGDIVKLSAVLLPAIGEALLSRITAKVKEQPIIPVSVPVDE